MTESFTMIQGSNLGVKWLTLEPHRTTEGLTPGVTGFKVRTTLHGSHLTRCCTVHFSKNHTSVYTWHQARETTQRSGNVLEIVAVFYFLRLVSQRFRPLQGMLPCAMCRALRDKLHESLHSVTTP